MDSTKMLMLGGAGVAVWWFYLRTPTPTAATVPGASTPPIVAPGAGPVVTPAIVAAGPSLDTLYGQLVAAVGAAHQPGTNDGPDQYGSILMQIYPAVGVLPDPNQTFAGTGWARPSGMPIAAYWSVMAPWLKANKGLSGIGLYGLGIFGSLCCGLGAR